MSKKSIKEVDNGAVDEDWDSWNPMAESYYDPALNSYNKGPAAMLPMEAQPLYVNERVGSADVSSASSSSTSSNSNDIDQLTLIIRHVPEGLTETGVRNILVTSGVTPKAVRIIRRAKRASDLKVINMGFIEFKSPEEAKFGLTALQNRPPWNMKLKFAARPESQQGKDQLK